jgi:excisionase family DNA binding protein
VTPSYLKKAEYAMPDNRHNSGADPPPPLEQVLDRLDALERKLDALLTEQEAADLLGVTARTMQTMRKTGEINALRVRSAVRYHRSTLREYIRARAREGVR